MKTFNSFMQDRGVNYKIIECATLMADKNICPDVFLKTWYDTNEPMVSLHLAEAGFWDGVGQGVGTAWQGVKNAAGQIGQGVKQGIQNYQRTAHGPMAQYQNAVKTLGGLVGYMQKDPQLAVYSDVTKQINKILTDLRGLQPRIPDNVNGQWKSQIDPTASQMGKGYVPPTPIPPQNFGPDPMAAQMGKGYAGHQPWHQTSTTFPPQYNPGVYP